LIVTAMSPLMRLKFSPRMLRSKLVESSLLKN
jgi:hypothetical protein